MIASVQSQLENALRAAAPEATLVRGNASNSADADWFRMVHAPNLVTGAGSFAVTAAIASLGDQVRTPAASNLNFPNRPTREVEQLADHWRTYSYSPLAMQGRRLAHMVLRREP